MRINRLMVILHGTTDEDEGYVSFIQFPFSDFGFPICEMSVTRNYIFEAVRKNAAGPRLHR